MRKVLQNLSDGLSMLAAANWPKEQIRWSSSVFAQADEFMNNGRFMNKTQKRDSDKMELLVSKQVDATSGIPSLSRRMKLLLVLLGAGTIALTASMFAVFRTGDSKERIQEIGLDRVANSLENVLSLMALPVVLFLVLFLTFICQQICKEYRSVVNPKIYGRSRKHRDDD